MDFKQQKWILFPFSIPRTLSHKQFSSVWLGRWKWTFYPTKRKELLVEALKWLQVPNHFSISNIYLTMEKNVEQVWNFFLDTASIRRNLLYTPYHKCNETFAKLEISTLCVVCKSIILKPILNIVWFTRTHTEPGSWNFVWKISIERSNYYVDRIQTVVIITLLYLFVWRLFSARNSHFQSTDSSFVGPTYQ